MFTSLSERYQAFQSWLWRDQLDQQPLPRAILLSSLRITQQVADDLHSGLLNLRAMSLVYTTLLSLVPLLAVSFSVLKGFGVHNQVEPLLLNLLAPLGEQGVQISDKIIEFVDNTQAMALGSLGLGILIFTVISLMQKIEEAFNHTWHLTTKRSFAQRFSNYLSVIVIGPVLVFSALGISASMLSTTLMQQLIHLPGIGWLVDSLKRLLPYLLVSSAFTLIYLFIPNTRVHFRSALLGGLIAAALWQSCGWLFASFVAGSSSHAAIYSAFAALILFIIWLYLGWLILLIGSAIAFHHQHPDERRGRLDNSTISIQEQELLGLAIMRLIAQRHYQQQPPLTNEALCRELALPDRFISPLLSALQHANIITACQSDDVCTLMPSRPLDTLMLSEVLGALRSYGDSLQLAQKSWYQPSFEQNAALLQQENLSLHDLSVKAFSMQ